MILSTIIIKSLKNPQFKLSIFRIAFINRHTLSLYSVYILFYGELTIICCPPGTLALHVGGCGGWIGGGAAARRLYSLPVEAPKQLNVRTSTNHISGVESRVCK